jgi:hypothetical protein
MSDFAARAPAAVKEPAAAERVSEQVGAATFSDLVRAHYHREQQRQDGHGHASGEAEEEYRLKLGEFEKAVGKLAAVYWSTRNASAVALTIGEPRGWRNPFSDTEMRVRLHRVTDWVTKNAEPIAELLHECDMLAIRASEILRGTSERIALQWIYSVQEHVLGYIERASKRDAAGEQELVASQRKELAKIEDYYLRTGGKAGRIVYVSGMLVGAVFIVLACVGTSIGLALADYGGRAAQLLVLCTGAGAIGALVSVLSRMGMGFGQFTIDFEVGRPLLRRLGVYKPFVGAVFGVALYFLLQSGLLMTQAPTHSKGLYFYGVVAFLAGFSERFTGVVFGQAERLISGDAAPSEPPQQQQT